MSSRREQLERAYRRARYRVVVDDEAGFDMIIGRDCEPARRLLERAGACRAAFLTAWNPRSEQRSDRENQAAQAALRTAVTDAGYPFLEGAGLDPDGDWPPEPSLLVLGIGGGRARDLARRFGQNAFVGLSMDTPPMLVWTDD